MSPQRSSQIRSHNPPTDEATDSSDEVERLRQECAKLRTREERYRNFVEISAEGIWCFQFDPPVVVSRDEDRMIDECLSRGVIVECNQSLASMYGFADASHVLGTSLADFMSSHPEDNREYMRAFVRSGFRLEDGESHEQDRSGNPKIFLNNLVGVVRDGQLVEVWGSQRDVTEQRVLESQLRQAQKMEAVGQLAGGIAHDFNNMLTVILGNLDTAMLGLDPESDRHHELSEAGRAAERAAGLTRQLLTFSRHQVSCEVALDVNDVVNEAVGMLRRVVSERIEFDLDLAPELPRVWGDRSEMEQALVNLVLNARDAMPSGGSVTIRTLRCAGESYDLRGARAEDGVWIQVSDTGVGIERDALPRLFEPFFTTKEPGVGSGLGLAMVYATVSRCGGDVWADSERGDGSTFHIRLPSCESVRPKHGVTAEAASRPIRRGTILVVEDQEDVRRLTRKLLEAAGHRVLEAATPSEALKLTGAFSDVIDLLLTDVILPGQTGVELAMVLRTQRPGMGVLLMSGYADLPEGETGARLRDLPMLPKPFTAQALRTAVQAALADPVDRNGFSSTL